MDYTIITLLVQWFSLVLFMGAATAILIDGPQDDDDDDQDGGMMQLAYAYARN
ncbi:hypothetical protein [Synechococcus phage S-B68]|nr:hypothetical protein [Synechococcus phage S-B68]